MLDNCRNDRDAVLARQLSYCCALPSDGRCMAWNTPGDAQQWPWKQWEGVGY